MASYLVRAEISLNPELHMDDVKAAYGLKDWVLTTLAEPLPRGRSPRVSSLAIFER
jgi:hypothetical protein